MLSWGTDWLQAMQPQQEHAKIGTLYLLLALLQVQLSAGQAGLQRLDLTSLLSQSLLQLLVFGLHGPDLHAAKLAELNLRARPASKHNSILVSRQASLPNLVGKRITADVMCHLKLSVVVGWQHLHHLQSNAHCSFIACAC